MSAEMQYKANAIQNILNFYEKTNNKLGRREQQKSFRESAQRATTKPNRQSRCRYAATKGPDKSLAEATDVCVFLHFRFRIYGQRLMHTKIESDSYSGFIANTYLEAAATKLILENESFHLCERQFFNFVEVWPIYTN